MKVFSAHLPACLASSSTTTGYVALPAFQIKQSVLFMCSISLYFPPPPPPSQPVISEVSLFASQSPHHVLNRVHHHTNWNAITMGSLDALLNHVSFSRVARQTILRLRRPTPRPIPAKRSSVADLPSSQAHTYLQISDRCWDKGTRPRAIITAAPQFTEHRNQRTWQGLQQNSGG